MSFNDCCLTAIQERERIEAHIKKCLDEKGFKTCSECLLEKHCGYRGM